jgi:signal transduction histidine kinase
MLSHTNNAVIFSVRDEGIGIPLEAIPHVFKPYWRADNVSHMQGTGLGLAIVKHYVDLHGGTIYCHSKEGEGTTFTVNLPVREAANTA